MSKKHLQERSKGSGPLASEIDRKRKEIPNSDDLTAKAFTRKISTREKDSSQSFLGFSVILCNLTQIIRGGHLR